MTVVKSWVIFLVMDDMSGGWGMRQGHFTQLNYID